MSSPKTAPLPTTIRNALRNALVHPNESRYLLSRILNKEETYVFAHPEYILKKKEVAIFSAMMNERSQGKPLAYIAGSKEFFGNTFTVTPNTLIPRPETEILVEKVLQFLEKHTKNASTIVDVGVGSGCILLSVVSSLKKRNIFFQNALGIDISEKALRVARHNAKLLHLEKDISFVRSDLLDFLFYRPPKSLHSLLIAANLPYVSESYLKQEKTALTKGLAYEPAIALNGGRDGFSVYRALLQDLKTAKKKFPNLPMHCFFEIGSDQRVIAKKAIEKIFPKARCVFAKDLSKKIRIVSFSL